MQDFNINSKPAAHMVAQSRAKQLAARDAQNRVKEAIVKAWEEKGADKSGEAIEKEIVKDLESFYDTSKSINDYLEKQGINNIGYPIRFNKTNPQLKMAWDYAKEQEDNLIEQITNGKFYNGLSNNINPNELPVLQSNSKKLYWGNEDPSVSSVLLKSIATTLKAEPTFTVGAATYYSFLNSEYRFPEELIPSNYPFANKSGMTLFGDYQYGGHRYFKDQLIFGPEDCSSSVGKATYLTIDQVKTIYTGGMRDNPSQYGYKLVTTLNSDVEEKLKLIQPGDIYLYKSHTAIIATEPDNHSNITTVQFDRDIDREENKMLGGGMYDYNLIDKAKDSPVYILRANLKPLHEEISLPDFLNTVDTRYVALYPGGPTEDIVGDCRIFFEYQEQA